MAVYSATCANEYHRERAARRVGPSPLASALIPDSWLDPLLTGPSAVIGKPPYTCKDIERLLWALRERLRAALLVPTHEK